jgi:hypothetical protein
MTLRLPHPWRRAVYQLIAVALLAIGTVGAEHSSRNGVLLTAGVWVVVICFIVLRSQGARIVLENDRITVWRTFGHRSFARSDLALVDFYSAGYRGTDRGPVKLVARLRNGKTVSFCICAGDRRCQHYSVLAGHINEWISGAELTDPVTPHS